MPPINVIDLRDTFEIGGPGKTILETHRAIDQARFRLHVGAFLGTDEPEDTPFLNAARSAGMPVHVIRGSNPYDPRLVMRVAALVKKLKIDIIHSHEVSSNAITCLASLIRPVPILATAHGWIGNSRRQRTLIALDRQIVRRFDCVVAVSARIRDQLHEAGVSPGRVRLIHNAIVVENYRRTGQVGFLAGAVGRPLHGPVLTSIGRLSPEKGHADLIDAVKMVVDRGFKVSLVLVGEGPARPLLEQQISKLGLVGTVHLTGHVNCPERVLEETDLAVLPSHTEGLPNAALEALMMGVPVLATRVGGTPEVIKDGETGRLVSAHAPEELAAALQQFLSEPHSWHQMTKRGRAMVEAEFDFQARTRKMEELYSEMAARRC